ncbi:MAG TPA: hypothetical protein VFX29_06180 [Longimicrobiaceae bacterium]|jgi:hypothetical protein|nr:hypothetical protein [Longimicrobiaceae bacterium]
MRYGNSSRRLSDAELYVNRDDRPGWPTADERLPDVGDQVYCAQGPGEVIRILGKTSSGSRLIELRLEGMTRGSFFVAGDNVLVDPDQQITDAAAD